MCAGSQWQTIENNLILELKLAFRQVLTFWLRAWQMQKTFVCLFVCLGEPDIQVVSRYLQRMKRVYPAVEGRIKFSSGSLTEASLTLISVLFTVTFLHTWFFGRNTGGEGKMKGKENRSLLLHLTMDEQWGCCMAAASSPLHCLQPGGAAGALCAGQGATIHYLSWSESAGTCNLASGLKKQSSSEYLLRNHRTMTDWKGVL